jgi:hypothetical protein
VAEGKRARHLLVHPVNARLTDEAVGIAEAVYETQTAVLRTAGDSEIKVPSNIWVFDHFLDD